jgi:hypothetical protein
MWMRNDNIHTYIHIFLSRKKCMSYDYHTIINIIYCYRLEIVCVCVVEFLYQACDNGDLHVHITVFATAHIECNADE